MKIKDLIKNINKTKQFVDALYKKLYSVRFTEDVIFEDKNKFIGYEISIKK